MSEVVLEISNSSDLQLLLTLVQRLNIKVVAVKELPSQSPHLDAEKIALLKKAANDPLFLEDVEAVMDDFAVADKAVD